MAQRRREGRTFPAGLFLRTSLLLSPLTGQPEEGNAVPAGAGSGKRYGAERGITVMLKAEPVRQNLDQKGPSFPLPGEQGTRQGQAAIGRGAALLARGADWSALDCEEFSRRDDP